MGEQVFGAAGVGETPVFVAVELAVAVVVLEAFEVGRRAEARGEDAVALDAGVAELTRAVRVRRTAERVGEDTAAGEAGEALGAEALEVARAAEGRGHDTLAAKTALADIAGAVGMGGAAVGDDLFGDGLDDRLRHRDDLVLGHDDRLRLRDGQDLVLGHDDGLFTAGAEARESYRDET